MKISTISTILSVAGIATGVAAEAITSSQTCVPYNSICFQNGMNYGACCGDGICAGSRCRNPKIETGAVPTTGAQTGAIITQISDGQIQAPTGAPPISTPTIPVVAGAGKAIPGMAAAGIAVAFLL